MRQGGQGRQGDKEENLIMLFLKTKLSDYYDVLITRSLHSLVGKIGTFTLLVPKEFREQYEYSYYLDWHFHSKDMSCC